MTPEQAEQAIIAVVQLMEQAKQSIDMLRLAKAEEVLDGRALSVANTYLETSMLWVANARK